MTGTPHRRRYDSLDAWRGVACLLVICYHSSLIYLNHPHAPATGAVETLSTWGIRAASYGNVGVSLFFVISGYCIAAAAQSVRSGRHTPVAYFRRRFRRIYPPFWAVVALSILFFFVVDVLLWPRLISTTPWIQPRPWWYSPWQWLGNLTLAETWRWHIVGEPRAHFPGQSWTLCYEEQFYAVMGLLLILSRPRFYSGVVAVTALTVFVMAGRRWWGWSPDGFFFDGAWLLFAAGVLVYWVVHEGYDRRYFWATLALLTVGVALLLGMPGSTAVAFIFAVVLLVLHPFDSRLVQSRWLVPLTFCGEMCYSLYLVHQLLVKTLTTLAWNRGLTSATVTMLVVMPICILASAVCGRVCFRTIECRFLNTPRPAPIAYASHAGQEPRPGPSLSAPETDTGSILTSQRQA